MSLPEYWPKPQYISLLPHGETITLRELCQRAQVACKATGRWTLRPVTVTCGATNQGAVLVNPNTTGVYIEVPEQWGGSPIKEARYALGVMAYGIFDLVAKESIKGTDWSKIAPLKGPKKSGLAMSNRERQRKFRQRIKAGSE